MKIKILLVIILSLLITGCWNYRELNEMAILGSIGIDYDEENKMFIVSFQVFNAKKSSNEGGSGNLKSPVTYYEKEGKTIHEALRDAVNESPKKLYMGHLDLVVLGQKLVNEHFMDALDFLFRDSESRKNFNMFVTKDCDAKDVLKILTPLETIPSASLSQTLIANSTYKSSASLISFDEALSSSYKNGMEVVLPVVEIVGVVENGEKEENINEVTQKTTLIINNNAIFKEEKLIGYLTEEESLGYNFITGQVDQTLISFPCDDEGNYGSIEVIKASTKNKIKGYDDYILGDIEISGEANLSEFNCAIDLTSSENIDKIEKSANEKISEIVNKTVNTVLHEYNTDIFGFGNQIYKNQYSYWKNVKDNWYEYFSKIKVGIESNIKIKNKGSIITSTKEG